MAKIPKRARRVDVRKRALQMVVRGSGLRYFGLITLLLFTFGATARAQRPSPDSDSSKKRDLCSVGNELARVSVSRSVWLEEHDAWNHHYALDRDSTHGGKKGADRLAQRSAWPEVDPRSTLVVHFEQAERCSPPFKVRLRGVVRKPSGSTRSLEIPRYFQAGVAQAEPQSRTFAWKSAIRILTGISDEIDLARRAAMRGGVPLVSSTSKPSEPERTSRIELDRLAELTTALETRRREAIESAATLTVRSQLAPGDSAAADSASVNRREVAKLTDSLDLTRSAQSRLGLRLNESDRAQQFSNSQRELRELLAVPRAKLAVRLLRQPEYAPTRRELAARLETEHIMLDSLLSRLYVAFASGDDVLKRTAVQSEGITADLLRITSETVRKAEDELLSVSLQVAKKDQTRNAAEDPLLLPNAEIPLRGSSVAEGEQVSLEILLIADDGATLASATYELTAIKLGGTVRNIRDVALFLNRCSGGSSLTQFCRTGTESTEEVARSIRKAILGDESTRLDLLRLDALDRSRDIPFQDRYVPVPGVVFEALLRPRVLETDGTSLRRFKKAVRTLGLSAGVSVSFVSYTDRRVTVNLPTVDQLRSYYADTIQSSRAARADTLFRIGSSDVVRRDLSIAPAMHLGIFDGAVSWAFGANLRATSGRFFSAVGFSFIGLTEAGAKLIGSLKGT
jgi:hypothetical protein